MKLVGKGGKFTYHEVCMLIEACEYYMKHTNATDRVFEMDELIKRLEKYNEGE